MTIGPFTLPCTPLTHFESWYSPFDDTCSRKLSGKFIERFEVALQDHGKIKQISTNFLIKTIHMFAQVVYCYRNWFHNAICYFFKQVNFFSLAIYKLTYVIATIYFQDVIGFASLKILYRWHSRIYKMVPLENWNKNIMFSSFFFFTS